MTNYRIGPHIDRHRQKRGTGVGQGRRGRAGQGYETTASLYEYWTENI